MILSFIIITIISLLTLFPSFSLSLNGDDWLAFFRFRQHVDPGFSHQWNYLTYYLTPYGAQDIIMGLQNKIFGFSSSGYFIDAFILRLLAAFSFYPLVFYLTRSKLAAFFASLFFSITIIGFDTTNWLANMSTYLTIGLFNIFLLFFLKSRENNKLLLPAGLFYYLAYITAPIRMHGSLPFILLLELFWLGQNRSLKTLKKISIRLGIILMVFLIIRFTGHSQGPAEEVSQRLSQGASATITLLSQGRFDFLFYPVLMLGSMVFPDLLGPQWQAVTRSQVLFNIILPIFSLYLIFVLILTQNIQLNIKNCFAKIALAALFWSILILLTFQFNKATFSSSNFIISTLIGGYTIVLFIFLLVNFFKDRSLSTLIYASILWAILSFFFAWWWVPTSIFPTFYRYLIVSAMGVAFFLSALIKAGKSKKSQIILFSTMAAVIIIHIIATRTYLNYLLEIRSAEITNKIWSAIPRLPDMGKDKNPYIFYFEGDSTNGAILHDSVTFGFPPHMALLYGLKEGDAIPIPMSDLKELILAVVDGSTLPAYGYPVKPFPVERIYAFNLSGKDQLTDITTEVRQKLKVYTH